MYTCIFTLNLDWVRNTIYVCPNGAINWFFFKRNSLDFFSIKTFIQPSNKKLKQAHKWIRKDKFNLKKKTLNSKCKSCDDMFFINLWYSRSRKISLLQCITCILKYQSLTCTYCRKPMDFPNHSSIFGILKRKGVNVIYFFISRIEETSHSCCYFN